MWTYACGKLPSCAPGTGAGPSLGLLIVERIVAGHDWTGSVECDGGTRFEFGRVERR
jgi:hypothetical protein